ncbi:MAG TPA: hypothetical protein VJ818_05200 [Actinomycetota bacterium]|nr:hypothetical protein [Actinomycetota bacterium]
MHGPADSIPVEMKQGGIETHGADWSGITVRVVDLPAGVDFTPMFVGLPGDLCQCPHWGYVFRGSIHVRYADGTEEVTRGGELYYWPGGHTGWSGPEGVSFFEFSPTEDITPVLTHLAAQMAGRS